MPRTLPLLALALAASAAAAVAQAPAAPAAPAQRTTMIGRHDNEVILAKIAVTDLVRSYRFYTEVVGLRLASPQLTPPSADDPERDFVEYPLNFTGSLADPFFVIMKRKGQAVTREGAGNTVVGFKVPSAKAAYDKALAAGAEPSGRPPGPGPMAFAMVRDPDGYTVEFVQAANHPAP
jgi:catechol 2,3-dioxygenase-like lactoylglutathione lyase family enzyme